jgi:uncharacterized protein (DUF1778 family)
MKTLEQSRFDTRLPKEQKDYFEYAASIGGFRTLTEFIIYSAQQQANSIVEKQKNILATKQDQEIFFNALLNPREPSETLKNAFKNYNKKLEAQ